MYRYLLTLGLHPPQAQEAAQEVFLRLYATMKKGEEIRNPRAWIFRVAHNLGLKIRARQNTEMPVRSGPGSRAGVPRPGPRARPARPGARSCTFTARWRALSEQQRRCLYLRLEGLRYPEIGSRLGISASAVGEFLRRAMARLRKVRHE